MLMRPEHSQFLTGLLLRYFADRPKQSPAQWCCENLVFDEPDNSGPFTLSGREYMREVIDSWQDPAITDHVSVFGSQAGKTGGIMGGAAWAVCNEPSRLFWVMPTKESVQKLSRTRWQKMVLRSACTAALVPTGVRRHEFKTCEQILGGSIIDMVWSNSPAALAGTPARIVILDEVDKFAEASRREADAVNLAEQRTKSFANPKRIKTSTPTLITGAIWQEFLKTDQRRRFLPCPHCRRFVVLIWSKNFTVFPLTGNEAVVAWDKESRRDDGSWDLDRVERSARFECPHCGGHIRDGHKTAMDRGGEWRPAAPAARGYRGWHLPSLYAASPESNVGKLAVKFLQAKRSLLGLQGFINGDLAEPYMSQDTIGERTELVTSRLEVKAEWRKLLTADCQAKSPLFWYVVRSWDGGNSEAIEAGHCDSWADLRARQLANGVQDAGVFVDSGFGAMSDAEVYRECAKWCEHIPGKQGRPPLLVGWMPCKGMPSRKRWRTDKGATAPHTRRPLDPFMGTSYAGACEIELLEFSGDFFKDILANLRKKIGYKWSVTDAVASDEYWKHLDAEVKEPVFNAKTGHTNHIWKQRSKHWPNHWLDCEVMQIAAACNLEWFLIECK